MHCRPAGEKAAALDSRAAARAVTVPTSTKPKPSHASWFDDNAVLIKARREAEGDLEFQSESLDLLKIGSTLSQ